MARQRPAHLRLSVELVLEKLHLLNRSELRGERLQLRIRGPPVATSVHWQPTHARERAARTKSSQTRKRSWETWLALAMPRVRLDAATSGRSHAH